MGRQDKRSVVKHRTRGSPNPQKTKEGFHVGARNAPYGAYIGRGMFVGTV